MPKRVYKFQGQDKSDDSQTEREREHKGSEARPSIIEIQSGRWAEQGELANKQKTHTHNRFSRGRKGKKNR